MAWRVIEEGEIPSLPLGRVKAAFRIHHDADDELLRHLIQVARQYIETYTQQILGDVRLELTIDQWERSKRPWSGLTKDMANPVIWIPLPIGPLRTLESVSVRANSGEWTDIPLERFILDTNRLGVKGGWPEIAFGIHGVRIVGQGGFTPLTSLVEGVWMNVVRCLYDSDLPDMTLVHDMIKPLKSLMFKALV